MLCKNKTLGIYSRDRAVSAKTHSENLCQTVHAVCGVHTGAGTTGRTNLALVLFYILLSHRTCSVGANCLKHAGKTALASFHMTCKHRTTTDKYGRDV